MTNSLRVWTLTSILSFKKQYELIARAAKELGLDAYVVDVSTNINPFKQHVEKQIVFFPGMPHYFLWAFKVSWRAYADNSIAYVTVEGKPKVNQHIVNILAHTRIIAVSFFAAEMMRSVGLHVEDYVYHAFDPDEVNQVLQENIEKQKGFSVGYVGSPIPRKGLPLLNEAARIVREKGYKDIIFYIWSHHWQDCQIPSGDNVVFIENFGRREHIDVLRFIKSLDLYVQPSLSEGFGLPIIESEALGVPVVSSSGMPMKELNNDNIGYLVPVKFVRYEDQGMGQDFALQYYNPQDMAEKIIQAYENRKELEEKGHKAKEWAQQFNYKNTYYRLVKLV